MKRIRTSPKGIILEVIPPNEVSDSKHAKLIRGIYQIFLDRYVYEPPYAQEISYLEFEKVDPFSLAGRYLDILSANRGEGTKSYLLCEALSKFPRIDYARFGDPNCIDGVSRAWFNEFGIGIDVQADIISENYGIDIQIQDIIDHVTEFKPGQYKKPLQQELQGILNHFRELFDFNLTTGYARFLCGIKPKVTNDDLPF